MLSYMLPVEEKPPSATAAAARNLSLNLTTTTTSGAGGGGGGVTASTSSQPKSTSAQGCSSRDSSSAESASVGGSTSGSGAGGGVGSGALPVVTRSIIKPTIKHNASHRYQLISGTGEVAPVGGPSRKQHQASHQVLLLAGAADSRSRRKQEAAVPGLWDESTNLLAGDPGEAEDDDDDDDDEDDEGDANDGGSRNVVKSDKNFNNLILVTNGNVGKGGSAGAANGGQCRKSQGNGNHATSVKLASVLKHTNSGSGSRTAGGASNNTSSSSSSSSSSSNGSSKNGGHTGATGGFYNGYIALSGETDDEQHRLLVSANNLRNSSGKQPATSTIGDYDVDDLVLGAERGTTATTELLANHSTNSSSNSSNSSTSRAMNSLNGNLVTSTGRGDSAEVMDLSESARVSGGDASIGSDSDSVTGAGGAGAGAGGEPGAAGANTGGKKVKLNKLGGNKNVTLKRVSFGSSKGSMVETLVFETPTPLPEHAEREFFQSPAVLAGAGHTTLYSAGGGSSGPGAAPHHHYPATHAYHHPHHHQYHVVQQQQQQQHQQHLPGGYHSLDGGTGIGHHDDSGIELQEEVERSKVRVTFFQSSKPQSISPPESLHLYGAQNLIQFGGTGLGGGGYDNNNSPLDSYITSAALNQQYDALPGHQQQLHQYEDFHPDHRDPAMAAVYGATAVPPAGYNRQMSTESGWDNPFRPGGDLSREADEIVNLIKGGKPITPTGDQSLVNGSTPKDSHSTDDPGATVVDGAATKLESSQLQAAQQNGTKSPHKTASGGTESTVVAKNGTTTAAGAPGTDGSAAANNTSSTTPISNQVIPGPQSASHVVIDEKKKKKCTCCVIQ